MRYDPVRGFGLLWLFLALLPVCLGCAEPIPPRPNIVLLVVDTLRADHLGSYGSTWNLTPNLDRFAEEGVTFRDALAQGPNTINSSASLLTSVYPSEHGFTHYKVSVADGHLTLAEILSDAGYDTFAVSTNPHVTARNGLAQGFDTFIDHVTWTDTDADAVNQIFLDWLAKRTSDKPFFAMLWYVDPHVPYMPPEDKIEAHVPAELRSLVNMRTGRPGFKKLSEEEMRVTKALYRGEVNYFDDQFGILRREMEQRDIFDEALILFTSDHGESFWERQGPDGRPIVGHGISLYREELAVPLLIRFPGGTPSRIVDTRVDSIDVVPSVVDFLKLPNAEEIATRLRGRSLLPLATGRDRTSSDTASISELTTERNGELTMALKSVETDEGKVVVTYTYRREQYQPPLVQLLDPKDGESIVPIEADDASAALRDRLLRRLQRWKLALKPIEPEGVRTGEDDAELVERLRSLGYLN